MNKAPGNDARAYLEQEVAERACHGNAEAVRVTCSFARAERLLGREYDLHSRLRDLDDAGLSMRASRDRFSTWMHENRLRLRAALETKTSRDVAKQIGDSLRVPPGSALDLDPDLRELLSPVVEALRREGLEADPHMLEENPAQEFARLGQFDSVDDLYSAVDRLLDVAERARFLGERASAWRREILLLAVASKAGLHETRANVRALAEQLDSKIRVNPSTPEELHASVSALFEPELARHVNGCLQDTLNAPAPHRADLLDWAVISADHLERVQRILEAPGGERARRVNADRETLRHIRVRPSVPSELQIPPPIDPGDHPTGPKPVRTIKIDASHDQRKRELGDEGERWARHGLTDGLIREPAASVVPQPRELLA